MKRIATVALGLSILITLSAVVGWLFLAAPASVAPILAGALGFAASKFYESWKESRGRLYDKKREVYAGLLRPYRHILVHSLTEGTQPQAGGSITPELIGSALEAAFDGILYASDDVVRRYSMFRNLGTAPDETPALNDLLLQFAQLLKAMRADLGHTFSSLDEVDILGTFVNIGANSRMQLKAALKRGRQGARA